jgi:hypothetical protein
MRGCDFQESLALSMYKLIALSTLALHFLTVVLIDGFHLFRFIMELIIRDNFVRAVLNFHLR